MDTSLEILEWDTQFFNYNIGKLEDNILCGNKKGQILEDFGNSTLDMVYYTSSVPLNENLNNFQAILVNKKVPIKKELNHGYPLHPSIKDYTETETIKELEFLAQRAGAYSRYNKDPHFSSQKVEELYRIWIRNSVERKMATDVIVYEENEKILGFVTLLIRNGNCETPLFAVSKDAEGRGVSFALMRAADTIVFKRGGTFYTSATQADNKPALAIFKRHGFILQPVEYVYHIWKENIGLRS